MERDTAEALEAFDHWCERGEQGQLLDLSIQRIASVELVLEQGLILAEYEPISGGERRLLGREMLEPSEVRRAPVGALAKHEAAAGEELEDVVAGFEDFPLKGFAAADDVAHPFLGLAGDPHRCEFAGAIQPGQLSGVVLVVLPLHAWPLGYERWRDYLARDAPFLHRAVEHVAGAARFVTRVDLTVFSAIALESFVNEIVERLELALAADESPAVKTLHMLSAACNLRSLTTNLATKSRSFKQR